MRFAGRWNAAAESATADRHAQACGRSKQSAAT